MGTKNSRAETIIASVVLCVAVYACLAWFELRAGHLLDRTYTQTFYLMALLEVITIIVTTPFGWALMIGSILFGWANVRSSLPQQQSSDAMRALHLVLTAAAVGAIATLVDVGNEPKVSSWLTPVVGGVVIGLSSARIGRRINPERSHQEKLPDQDKETYKEDVT